MTVSSSYAPNVSTGNGATTVFPYTFRILADSDVEVTVDGVVKTLTTDYTVSGVGADGGGNITFLSAPANGAKVIRRRKMALARSMNLTGDLLSSVLNEDQDAPVLIAQQIQEQVDRSLKFPLGDTASGTLPPASSLAGGSLAFDSNGNPIAGPALGDLTTKVAAAATSALNAAASESSAAAHDLSSQTHDLNAQTAKAGAQAAQTAAETARDAAQASGRIYASTAAGLAAVASGQYFWVVSASNAAVLDLYLNNAGSAVSQSKSIPSTAILSSDAAIGNAIQVWQDSAGERFAEGDSSGRMAVRDVLFGNARSLSALATTVDANTANMISVRGTLAREIDAARGENQTAPAAATDVFLTSRDGGPNYRVPVVVRLSASQFLVFAQRSTSTSDFTQIDIHCRTVTVASDGTMTLGSVVVVVAAADSSHKYDMGSAVRLANGNIVLLATYGPSDGSSHVPYKFVSTDNGATWSAGTDLSSFFPGLGTSRTGDGATTVFTAPIRIYFANQVKVTVGGVLKTLTTDYTVSGTDTDTVTVTFTAAPANGAAIVIQGWNAVIFGPGKGIVLRKGTYAGRVVFPFWHSRLTYPSGTNDLICGFLYSDDSCATFTIGARSWLSRGNESSVVEDWDGNVLLFSRRDQQAGRWVSLSNDGGAHITDSWQLDQTTVNTPVCQSSTTQCDNDFDFAPPKIIYSAPRPTTAATGTAGQGRDHPTIFASYDGGRTFPYRYEITTGATGYSAVESCGAGKILVVREFDANFLSIQAQVVTVKNILGV